MRYSDYEVPKAVRESIQQLQAIFDMIQKNQGKNVEHIFVDITNPDTQEVKIRDFVAKLVRLDPSLNEDDLFKCCRVLDADGSGTITLDEFLEFFGHLGPETSDSRQAEDELEDEMWPEWLIKEGKLPQAQTLLAAMHNVLEYEHAISAEQAFGIYDMKDSGECSVDEFRRILRIFFGEVLPNPADIEFLMRLTQRRVSDQRIDYRDFSKFLSKRVVRAFKSRAAPPDGSGGDKS